MERNDEEKIIKKRYLRSYRAHVHRRERLEEQLVELQAMKLYPSMKNNDGMPHGSSVDRDLSGYMAEKEIENPADVQPFDRLGYNFRRDLSSEIEYVFERKIME